LGKTLVINEGQFHELPNKNFKAIKVLFEVLDVQTILTCWKALLLDHSLAVISCQPSVQFYVIDGLKQLLFPFTWRQQYIQPAGTKLAELAQELPFPVIFACDSEKFEYENIKYNMEGKTVAILDVDGNFMNA
jgi:hypothetical protein